VEGDDFGEGAVARFGERGFIRWALTVSSVMPSCWARSWVERPGARSLRTVCSRREEGLALLLETRQLLLMQDEGGRPAAGGADQRQEICFGL
jgi:hypothetical protein